MNDFSIDTAREPTPQERDILQQSLLRPTDTSLNAPLLFDVSTMEPDRLACAVSTVLAHHTTLHSGIGQEENGSPSYRTAPPTICTTDSIPFADDSIALSLIQAMADVPFDYVAARALSKLNSRSTRLCQCSWLSRSRWITGPSSLSSTSSQV